jgi:hypothetical protein
MPKIAWVSYVVEVSHPRTSQARRRSGLTYEHLNSEGMYSIEHFQNGSSNKKGQE